MSGFTHPERVHVILDRSKAIEKSIQCAAVNDCILVAGKGAETYQQIRDVKHPFDDVLQVGRSLNQVVKENNGDI
jgi:UDP-N-acetylmuramoyl-L-alanyl-D-glutamate--2,6-diaminopimelate ligase